MFNYRANIPLFYRDRSIHMRCEKALGVGKELQQRNLRSGFRPCLHEERVLQLAGLLKHNSTLHAKFTAHQNIHSIIEA